MGRRQTSARQHVGRRTRVEGRVLARELADDLTVPSGVANEKTRAGRQRLLLRFCLIQTRNVDVAEEVAASD